MRYHRGQAVGHPVLRTDQDTPHDVCKPSAVIPENEDNGANDGGRSQRQDEIPRCDEIIERDALEPTQPSFIFGPGENLDVQACNAHDSEWVPEAEYNMEEWNADLEPETDTDAGVDSVNSSDMSWREQIAMEEMYGIGAVEDGISYD